MNNRERFKNVMPYQPTDRTPMMLAPIWPDTMARWLQEGYPDGVDPAEYFEVSPMQIAYAGPNPNLQPIPPERIIEETETEIIKTDKLGRTVRDFKDHTSMPEWIDWPVKSPADLERIINDHFDMSHMDDRWPDDWDKNVKLWSSDARGDTIVLVNGGSYYGTLRQLAGVEYASILFYDAPDLVDELIERVNLICLAGLERAMPVVDIDYVGFAEDIAFKTSTLISPEMFRQFLLPRYEKVMALVGRYGEFPIWLDTDGNFDKLIEMYLEVGVTGFGPMEVAAGMDPVEMRAKYGKKLRMLGGIDKREIARGPAAIDAQLEHIAPVVAEGGYIPDIDHSVSSDISLDNYKYFMKALKQLCGW